MISSNATTVEGIAALAAMPDILADLSRPGALRHAFEHSIPEFATGAITLDRVDVRGIRLREGSCTATYHLTVRSDHRRPRELRVAGCAEPWNPSHGALPDPPVPLGEPGWRCGIPELRLVLEAAPEDTALTALPVLLDPASARVLLESAIRAGNPRYAGLRIRACTPTVVRYKPGSRCTIAYELGYEHGADGRGWPDRVIAKIHRGAKGKIAFEGMRALWNSPLRWSPDVQIAEPLAFLSDVNVLIQASVLGATTLEDLLRASLARGDARGLREPLVRTARGLAALHRCGARAAGSATWHDELVEVRSRMARLIPWVPGLEEAGKALLARVEALASQRPAQPPVPSHRSFRPAQVLVRGEEIAFIDFDGFCEAEPAMDIALFLTTMENVGMRIALRAVKEERDEDQRLARAMERVPELEALGGYFLDAYADRAAISRERIDLWRAVYLFGNVLNCWAKVRPERIRASLALLDRHLRDRVGAVAM